MTICKEQQAVQTATKALTVITGCTANSGYMKHIIIKYRGTYTCTQLQCRIVIHKLVELLCRIMTLSDLWSYYNFLEFFLEFRVVVLEKNA